MSPAHLMSASFPSPSPTESHIKGFSLSLFPGNRASRGKYKSKVRHKDCNPTGAEGVNVNTMKNKICECENKGPQVK